MDNDPLDQSEEELEKLKKTTRISLEEALNAKPPPKKTTSILNEQAMPITGIPTHTSPIPQTIRLKRPATSPIVINPPDITSAPTIKAVHAKVATAPAAMPTLPAGEVPTIIKKTITPRPLNETSRIILDAGPQPTDILRKTAPIPAVSTTEPTPGPKTIRLKKPSAVIPLTQTTEQPPLPEPAQTVTARKSETSKIELPKESEFLAPTTQRKTIKIKRTDRNIIPRTVTLSRQPEAAPQAAKVAHKEVGAPIPSAPVQEEEPLNVFPILAGVAVVCLALLVYLLTSQAFGPKLILPVPSGLF